jgi:hypothetical protein
MIKSIRGLLASALLLCCGGAAAHVIGVVYNLPIPFWMYAFGASAALALSFLIVGWFVTAQNAGRNFRTIDLDLSGSRLYSRGLSLLRAGSVVALAVTILAGLVGPANPFANFCVIFFWIIFALGFMYATSLIGDVYALVNPGRVICDWIERRHPGAFRGRRSWPAWLGYYPAFLLYVGFIWLELFAQATPHTLGLVLLVYSILNIACAAIFGAEAWFGRGELFSVFLRLVGKMAPLASRGGPASESPGRVRVRQPFVGLLEEPADHFSLLMFVLFMLSSTAFDGIHETRAWALVFWKQLYPLLNDISAQPYLFYVDFYYYWQWAMLAASPFLYLAIYLFFVWAMKLVIGSDRTISDLALQFAFTLIPIAFVYNVTHYFTLLVAQGPSILGIISDPFGLGWNLFGTAGNSYPPVILLAQTVWHTQVVLILAGHIVSVYLAHLQALKLFPTGRQGVWSQLPMLALMMVLTSVGLRILSLPISAGQVTDPTPTSLLHRPGVIAGPFRDLG